MENFNTNSRNRFGQYFKKNIPSDNFLESIKKIKELSSDIDDDLMDDGDVEPWQEYNIKLSDKLDNIYEVAKTINLNNLDKNAVENVNFILGVASPCNLMDSNEYQELYHRVNQIFGQLSHINEITENTSKKFVSEFETIQMGRFIEGCDLEKINELLKDDSSILNEKVTYLSHGFNTKLYVSELIGHLFQANENEGLDNRELIETAKFLFNKMDKNFIDSDGNNLLHCAVRLENNELVNLLENKGVDFNHKNNYDKSPKEDNPVFFAQYEKSKINQEVSKLYRFRKTENIGQKEEQKIVRKI